MKKILIVVAFYGIARSTSAQADEVLAAPPSGSGQYGANRRVRTNPSGYTAVQGSFTLPQVLVPGIPFTWKFLTPTSPFLAVNPTQAKPSFFLPWL